MNILRYLTFIFAFTNPFKTLKFATLMRHETHASYLVSMAPGGHVSREATNKINPPGCSVNQSKTNKPDGYVEIRETITCTTVTTMSPSGKVTTKPASGSKQDKRDQAEISEYAKKRK